MQERRIPLRRQQKWYIITPGFLLLLFGHWCRLYSIEMIVILVFIFMIKRFERELSPKKSKAKSFNFGKWWARIDKKFFTKAVPVEREKDILLDHDYDGIRELDNPLPPWWKYGFYITIGIAIVYLLNYEVLGYGKNPTQEYNEEMAKAKIQMEAYAAKSGNTIDENNIKMPDASRACQRKRNFYNYLLALPW